MDHKNDKPTGRKAFDPASVDDFLGTGGGLLGDFPLTTDQGPDQSDEYAQWIGRHLGPYRVIQYLNRGGMALVFLAERQDGQFNQQVAIKLLHRHGGPELVQRFEREQELLAQMNHPGIAHILDAGQADGQPWIAMELVDGIAIDQYCDQHELDVDARLALFARAARAVQYAHGRLVVHRDLKPSNLLVDDSGHPKLLDFGIAKALESETDGASAELTGSALLLTPLYASPEQVKGELVGVASDVYQLGLLLYRLLTGDDAQAMDQASVEKIRNIVLEGEPLSPSIQVETTGRQDSQRLVAIAKHRHTSPAALSRRLTGDLDAVVLKALHKDPHQRYLSVENFVDDIDRYCAGHPVQARPASRWYRTQKLVQRHRGGAVAGLLMLLVLVGAAVSVALSWRTTIQAQQRALVEADGAREVGKFLSNLLAQADPDISGGGELTVRELLDAGARRLDELENQPQVQARLLEVVGSAYQSLQLPEPAEGLLAQALELRRAQGVLADQIMPLSVLAVVKTRQGELDEALILANEAVQLATFPTVMPELRATAFEALAQAHFHGGRYAEQRTALNSGLAALAKVNNEDVSGRQANLLMTLGSNSRQLGNYQQALEEFQQALVLLGDQPDHQVPRIYTLRDMGTLYSNLGDENQAVILLTDSLKLARKVYGSDSANILGNLVLLGRSLGNQNRASAAIELFDEAVSLAKDSIGEEHGNYARILHDFAEILRRTGDFERVKVMREQAAQIASSFFGKDHSTAVNLRKALAFVPYDEGRYPQAADTLAEVIPAVIEAFGMKHMITFQTRSAYSRALMESGRLNEALPLMLELAEQGLTITDGDFPGYARHLQFLAQLQLMLGDLDAAATVADKAVVQMINLVGEQDFSLLMPLNIRATIFLAAGDAGVEADLTGLEQLLATAPADKTLTIHLLLTDIALTLARGQQTDTPTALCDASLKALKPLLDSQQMILAEALARCGEVALRRGDHALAIQLLEAAQMPTTTQYGESHWRTAWLNDLIGGLRSGVETGAFEPTSLRRAFAAQHPMLNLFPGQ